MDLKPGQMLGPYRIEERLVSGGMAKVYRALQASTGREVAIKVLSAPWSDASTVARFEREMRMLAGLQHPHILGLIDAGCEPPWHYLVLPLVRCGDLADRLAREGGPLPPPLVRRIALQLCDALGYAHANGIVHRDLKPANVLLDAGDNVLLSDFGIALSDNDERLTLAGHAIGTPEYLAPEQIGGHADARSDLYALGVVVFEMLTGRLPFPARSAADAMRAHREAPIPSPRAANPALPIELDALIARAIAKLPGDRFQSAAEFAAAVRSALPDEAGGTRPSAATTVMMPPGSAAGSARRSRRATAVALGVVVLALAALMTIQFSTTPAPTAATAERTIAAGQAPTNAAPPSTAERNSGAPAPLPAPSTAVAAKPPTAAANETANPGIRAAATPAALVASEHVYDTFDDPRFDGSFDPARWRVSRDAARMRFVQHEGTMQVTSQEQDQGLYATLHDVRVARVAARARIDAPVVASQASIGISLSHKDRPGAWVSCYLYATRGATTATPACTDQRRSEFRYAAATPIDAWHDLQITMMGSNALFIVDGRPIGGLPFDEPNAPGTWYVLLSGWSADGRPVEGEISGVDVAVQP